MSPCRFFVFVAFVMCMESAGAQSLPAITVVEQDGEQENTDRKHHEVGV